MNITAGQIIAISEGSYSDRGILGSYVANQDFNTVSLMNEWGALHPEQGLRYKANTGEFVRWLIDSKKVLAPATLPEWHIGSYSSLGYDANPITYHGDTQTKDPDDQPECPKGSDE